MIQRIQSLYFLLLAIVASLLIFLKLATLTSGELKVDVFFNSIKGGGEVAVESALFNLSVLALMVVSLIAIFLFKNRKAQLLITKINYLITTVLLIGIYLYLSAVMAAEFSSTPSIETGLAIYCVPLLIVFNFLAGRGVSKDEKLIRSVDRLR